MFFFAVGHMCAFPAEEFEKTAIPRHRAGRLDKTSATSHISVRTVNREGEGRGERVAVMGEGEGEGKGDGRGVVRFIPQRSLSTYNVHPNGSQLPTDYPGAARGPHVPRPADQCG